VIDAHLSQAAFSINRGVSLIILLGRDDDRRYEPVGASRDSAGAAALKGDIRGV
jgi:hypothetical protein